MKINLVKIFVFYWLKKSKIIELGGGGFNLLISTHNKCDKVRGNKLDSNGVYSHNFGIARVRDFKFKCNRVSNTSSKRWYGESVDSVM
jgi:hypothetical protein